MKSTRTATFTETCDLLVEQAERIRYLGGAMLQSLGPALAAALCSFLVLCGGPIWDVVGTHGELHGTYVPRYEEAARALQQLRIPLWNPNEFAGMPLLGTAHGGMLYPPIPVVFSLLAPHDALQVLYLLHAALLGWGTCAYLQRLGVSPWIGSLAALVALAGVFNGLAGIGVDHPPILMGLAWVPIQLIAVDAVLAGSTRAVALLAFAIAMQWLCGYPQYVPDTVLLLGLVTVIGYSRPSLIRRSTLVVAGCLLGTALAAAQILPSIEMGRESMRMDELTMVAQQRAIYEINSSRGTVVLPYDLRFVPAFILAALALTSPDRKRGAFLLAFLWATFPVNAPFSWLYAVPPMNLVRNPLEWAYLSALLLGLLAALGAQQILARWRWLGVGLGAAAACLLALVVVRRDSPYLVPGGAPDYQRARQRAEILQEYRRLVGTDPRVFSMREIVQGSSIRHDLPSISGFEPALRPRRMDRLLQAMGMGPHILKARSYVERLDLALLMGIGIIVPDPGSRRALDERGFVQLGQLEPGIPAMYRPPVSRARIAFQTRSVSDPEWALSQILSFPQLSLESPLVESPELALHGRGAGTATVVVDEPERVEIDATLSSSGLLVLRDNAFPGWRAYVDGHESPIYRVDYTFRGVRLSAGSHHVVFAYEPASFWWGAAISLAAVVPWIALAVRRERSGDTGRRSSERPHQAARHGVHGQVRPRATSAEFRDCAAAIEASWVTEREVGVETRFPSAVTL